MLDLLVGNEDRLPENWVRKFEVVEEVYIQFSQDLHLRYARPESNFQLLTLCNGVSVTRATEPVGIIETGRKKFSEDEITEPMKNSCKASYKMEFIRDAE